MIVNKARHIGFCFGVKHAVDKANEILCSEEKLYCLGEIIHNKDAIDKLKEKGLIILDSVEEALKVKDGKVLIRSHGVGEDVIKALENHNIEYIDATCPRVKKIHKIVQEYSGNGYDIIIIGDENHPEIKGIIGWISGNFYVVKNYQEIENLFINREKKYCLVCQTTFYNNIYKEIVEFLVENDYTNIVMNNTICDATKNRQDACAEIASESDVMLVVGGKSSSNTKKLYELAKKSCDKTFLIENFKEIPYKSIEKNTRIGITAGASTPDWVIEEVIENVRESKQNNE